MNYFYFFAKIGNLFVMTILSMKQFIFGKVP